MISYSRQYLFPKGIKELVKVLKSKYYKQGLEIEILKKKLSNSKNHYSTTFSIPINFSLSRKKQFKIVNLINSFFKK